MGPTEKQDVGAEQSTPVDESRAADEAEKRPPFYSGLFTYFRLLFAAEPTWVDMSLICFGTVTAAAAGVPFPLMGVLFGQIVDGMNSATCAVDGDLSDDPSIYETFINDKVIKTAYIGAIALALIYAYVLSWSVISQRLAQRLRTRYVAALLRQPPAFFDARAATAGEVSSRLHGDIAAVQAGTSEKVGIVIASISFVITVFVIAFLNQPRIAGMLMSMLPAFLLSAAIGGFFAAKHGTVVNDAIASASSIASEALSHIPVVQAFGAGPRLEAKFTEHLVHAQKAGTRKAAVSAVQAGLLFFIAYSGNALAFWQGSIQIADTIAGRGDGSTIGEIYAVVYLLVDACVMLGSIAPILPFLGGATAAYQRLMKDIETPSAIDGTLDTGEIVAVDTPKGMTFRNVTFAYSSRPGQTVLRNIDLDFPAGRYTAIVGRSGSGKSTVAALVARLYDPTEGVVALNGKDVRDLNVRSLRSFVSFVQQEPSLLDRSVFENIALGLVNSPKPSHQHLKPLLNGSELAKLASKGRNLLSSASGYGPVFAELAELVRHAAEQADAAGFIENLEDGYGTFAGPSGSLLSGGQRQRIALARALIRDPSILVLDEATSALDSSSEQKIQAAVEKAATGDRAIISIAHRLSTIRNADLIIVMDAGEVVEQGTYDELMAKEDGPFVRMARLQSLGQTQADARSLSSASFDGSSFKTSTLQEKARFSEKETNEEATERVVAKDARNEPPQDATFAVETPFRAVCKRLATLVRPSLGYLAVAVAAATVVGGMFSGSGVIFGFTVGALNPCASTVERVLSLGRFFSGLVFGLACLQLLANFLSWSCFGVIAERLLYSLRVLTFRSLLGQDVQWHQSEGRTPSGLLAILTKDSAAIGGFSGSTVGTVFSLIVNVTAAIILSHIVAWKIALVCLATIPLLLGSGFMQLRMLARYEERNAEAFLSATSVATEAIQSIRTVAALSLEGEVMNSYSRHLADPHRQMVKASAATNIWLAISNVSATFVNALAYWWGTQLILRGEYSQTQFLIILVAMLTSAQMWGTMFSLAPEFSRARTALSRIMAVIGLGSNDDVPGGKRKDPHRSDKDIEAEGETRPNNTTRDARGVRVTFDNVSFAYPSRPDIKILDGVSLDITAGQFCGLVGPSGAGKSTIMNLVQRLYKPLSGTISINGHDIDHLPAAFRNTIAIVPQEPALFDDSVRFNVGLGAVPGHEATDEEIEEACKLANIHDVIVSLPDGYNTECGPSASRLSGGQRQRLAIARALVRRPRLLLLDESTSALDATSEAALQEGLERASRGTTVLAITHRLHTVQKADVIFVVEGGQIVDSGRHSELMQRRESYRVNAMQQMLQ